MEGVILGKPGNFLSLVSLEIRETLTILASMKRFLRELYTIKDIEDPSKFNITAVI